MTRCASAAIAVAFSVTHPAYAQVPPGTAPERNVTPLQPRELLAPPRQPGVLVDPPGATASAAPAPATDPVRITAIEIVGDAPSGAAVPPPQWEPPSDPSGTARLIHESAQPLDKAWVEAQYRRRLDGGIRPSEAIAITQLVNRAYVTAGFVNSGVLVEGVQFGTLRLRLVMGQLGGAGTQPLMVDWRDGRSGGLDANYVRARFASASARPLDALAIEREFRLLTEDPAIRSVNAALRPGAMPGEASLHLLLQPARRFDAYMGVANDRSPSVGSRHFFAGVAARNLLLAGDLLGLEGGVTRGAKDGQLSYSAPFLSWRNTASVRLGFNNAAVVEQQLIPLDIRSRDRNVEIGLARHLRRSPLMPAGVAGRWSSSETLTVGARFGYRRQKSYLLGERFSFAPGSVDGRTEYKVLRLTGDYVRRNVDHLLAFAITTNVGLGGTQSDIPSVPNPSDHFVAVVGQLDGALRLEESGLQLRGRLLGQYSKGILYSGERLSIGGASSVRGYRESLFLVDRGAIGTVELSYPFSIGGRRSAQGESVGAFTAALFADGAMLRNAHPPQPSVRSIGSIGASLSWEPVQSVRAIVTYAKGLRVIDQLGDEDLQDRGIHFRLVLQPLQMLRPRA